MNKIKAEILGIDPHPMDASLRVHYRIGSMEGWVRSKNQLNALVQKMNQRIARGSKLSRDTVFDVNKADRPGVQFLIGV